MSPDQTTLVEFSIFISCPSDCESEKNIAVELIAILESTYRGLRQVQLRPIFHRMSLATGVAASAQDVISEQVAGSYDSYLGFFWSRLGTPTANHRSGTIEEMEQALAQLEEGRTQGVHIYFIRKSLPDTAWEGSDLSGVGAFKKEIGNRGIYYRDIASTFELQKQIAEDIRHDVEKLLKASAPKTRENGVQVQANALELFIAITNHLNAFSSKLKQLGDDIHDYTGQMEVLTARAKRAKVETRPLVHEGMVRSLLDQRVKEYHVVTSRFDEFLATGANEGKEFLIKLRAVFGIMTKKEKKEAVDAGFYDKLNLLPEALNSALQNHAKFRATMVGVPSLMTHVIEPKAALIEKMGMIEDFLIFMQLELDSVITQEKPIYRSK